MLSVLRHIQKRNYFKEIIFKSQEFMVVLVLNSKDYQLNGGVIVGP